MGKALGTVVLQEHTRWFNHAKLLERDKDNILDMSIIPEGIFGSALTSTQRCCEAKKAEDEALQLCLLWKTLVHPQLPQCKVFTSVVPPRPAVPGPEACEAGTHPVRFIWLCLAQPSTGFCRSPAGMTGPGCFIPAQEEEEGGSDRPSLHR